jgi:hypothetical protein
MKLDAGFKKEVEKAANGDGSKEYRNNLALELRGIAGALGDRYKFDRVLKIYGRAKAAICVAETIKTLPDRFLDRHTEWARKVMELWTNRSAHSESAAAINIHPAILADNAAGLIKQTTAGKEK